MLGGLLKPGWQSESVEKRLQAVEALDPAQAKSQEVLEQLVEQDADQQVQHAALHKLTNLELVFKLVQNSADKETAQHAKVRLTTLIGAHSELSEADFNDLLEQQAQMRPLIAQHCPFANIRNELIEPMPIAEQVALLDGIEYTDTRQSIANRLENLEHLEQARKLLKGRDKQSEKIIKTKFDKLHAQQRLDEEARAAAEAICEKIEFLSTHDWRHEFTAKFHVWQQRWQELPATPSEDLQQRYTKYSEAVANIVAQHEMEGTCRATQQTLADDLTDYCKKIAGRSQKKLLAKQTKLAKKIAKFVEAWQSATEQITPLPNIEKQFKTVVQLLEEVIQFCASIEQANALESETEKVKALQAALAVLAWPKQFPELKIKCEVEAELADIKQIQREQQKAAAATLDKLHKRINRLLGVTKRGELARANRELAAITKAVTKYEGKDKAALTERLEKAAVAVKKMGDWKDFATAPKFVELCESMEGLIDTKMKPTKVATKINALQQQWKSLGYADSADEYWPKFKEAADKAYEPCADFFKLQRKTRKQNLQNREPLVKQMQDLLEKTDWDGEVDYKQVESELRLIANAWQKIKDVERAAGQKQWNRLCKLRAGVYEKMDVVYDANIELKNQLLAQAVALSENEVNEQTLGKLQLYQRKWKEVGITRRKQDQAVWRKFKKATDAVYQQIQDGRKSKREAEDAELAAYRDLIQQIQQLAKTSKELSDIDARFEQLQADYKALPELPKKLPEKLIQRIDSDFNRAATAYSKARDRIIQAGEQQELDALGKKAELCAKLEKLGADGDADKLQESQSAIDAIVLHNNEYQRRFKQRLAVVGEADRSGFNEQRRLLCIDLEILLGVDSPKEDAALRTKVQLERMQKQGIGHAQQANDKTIAQMKIDWLCLPGADADLQTTLDKRFAGLISR